MRIIEVEHQDLRFEGRRIHFVTSGAEGRAPLFLLHSFYVSWAVYKSYLTHLADRFYLVMPDLPGSGRSQPLSATNDNENFARVVEAIRVYLDLKKVNLFGFSAGGVLALKYAARFPERVGKLIEQGAPYYFKDYDVILRDKILLQAAVFPFFPKFLQGLARQNWVWPLVRFVYPNLNQTMTALEAGRLEKDIARLDVKAAYEWGKDILRIDLREDLKKIGCPVRIIAGEKDPYLSTDSIKRLATFLSQAEIDWVKDGDHEMTIKKPELIAGKIVEFLEG